MDRITLFKNKVKNAKQRWLSDKNESEEMYGEGVLTRRQAAKLEDNKNTEDPQPVINNDEDQTDNLSIASNGQEAAENPEAEAPNPKSESENTVKENDNEESYLNNIFKEETLVAENDLLQVFVIQSFFKRQKKFNLQDHLYTMHFKKKSDKPIVLNAVLDILEKAFFAVLENLKSFYKNEEENYVYMTLTQENLFNPFRTSPYVLQSNDTKQMVDHLMVNFNRFVNSNSNLPLLEKSFCVYFTVLSNAHVNHPNNRRKAIPIRHTVGMSKHSKIFLSGGLISLPQIYNEEKNTLPQNCLPTSLAFSYLKYSNLEKYQSIKKMLLLKSKKADKQEASLFLFTITQDLCNTCNIDLGGPHDLTDVCNKVAPYLNVQIHVILSMDGPSPSLLSFPSGNNNSLPRLYLQVQNDHVTVIDNLQTFFTHHRRSICFDCKIFFSNHWRKTHRCKRALSCFYCRGVLMTSDTIVDKNEAIIFCDSKIIKKEEYYKNCQKCNLNFLTKMCFLNHEKLCSSNLLGWKCLECGVFETGTNQTSNEELKAKHICGIKHYKCSFCYRIKDDKHVCQLYKQVPHDIWPNMCFLSMAFRDDSCGNCNNCYEIRRNYAHCNKLTYAELFKTKDYSKLMCDKHKNNNKNPSPNVITLYKEEKRHHFKEYIFCDDELNDALSENFNELIFPYSQKNSPMSKIPFKMKKTRQTVAVDFQTKIKQTFNKNEKSAIDKLMLFLCNSDSFSNYTIVVSESQSLLAILESFLKINLVPNVIQDGNQINFIELSCLKLKFVYNGNYLLGSISQMAKQFGVPTETYFFPNSWNQPNNYNYIGKAPPREDFYLFSDSNEEKCKKNEFYSTIEEPWCMYDSLIKSERLKCQTFSLCCLSFLTQCFELQDLLKKKYQKNVAKYTPYGWRISSLSGFTFAVFSYFFMNDFDMYTVMNPFAGNVTKTSQGEYEWTSWLNWKNYEVNIETAFNSFDGQKRFGKHAVDGYCSKTKTVYQFKGCEVLFLYIII